MRHESYRSAPYSVNILVDSDPLDHRNFSGNWAGSLSFDLKPLPIIAVYLFERCIIDPSPRTNGVSISILELQKELIIGMRILEEKIKGDNSSPKLPRPFFNPSHQSSLSARLTCKGLDNIVMEIEKVDQVQISNHMYT